MKIKKNLLEKSFAIKANDFSFCLNIVFTKMESIYNYFLTILGGSLKKIAKKITIRVPISRNV